MKVQLISIELNELNDKEIEELENYLDFKRHKWFCDEEKRDDE